MAGIFMTLLMLLGAFLYIFKHNKYVKKALGFVFWNLLIRFWMISFINYWYGNIYGLIQNDVKLSTVVVTSSILLIECVIWVLSFLIVFVKWDRDDLDKKETRKRVGNLY